MKLTTGTSSRSEGSACAFKDPCRCGFLPKHSGVHATWVTLELRP
jgi:hypothetical protein